MQSGILPLSLFSLSYEIGTLLWEYFPYFQKKIQISLRRKRPRFFCPRFVP